MTIRPKASWYEQKKVLPTVVCITEPHVHRYFSANIWLIEGRDADLIVDFGMGFARLLPELIRDPTKPLIAVATHAHVDHVGAFHEFYDRRGSAKSTEAFATMPDHVTLAHLFRSLPDPVSVPPSANWRVADYVIAPAPLTQSLVEGDRVDIGDLSFVVLELPGHSPDSIGLLDEATGLFISGDAIYTGQLVDDLPRSDPVSYVKTMRRLSELSVDLVLPGHNTTMSQREIREIAEGYVRYRERIEQDR